MIVGLYATIVLEISRCILFILPAAEYLDVTCNMLGNWAAEGRFTSGAALSMAIAYIKSPNWTSYSKLSIGP